METCFYCTGDQPLHELMIPLCDLTFSNVYLLRDQKYTGRCVVACMRHVKELHELTYRERCAFISDVSNVAKAISAAFTPDKLNYAVYGDLVPHLHVHLVPKSRGGPRWGEAFCDSDPKEPADEARLIEIREALLRELREDWSL